MLETYQPKTLRRFYGLPLILLGFVAAAGYLVAERYRYLSYFYEPQSANFSVCGSEPHVTCVVDGYTVWLNGEKIRLESIHVPDVHEPKCQSEKILGARAQLELLAVLNAEQFRIIRFGKDYSGRTLANFWMESGETAGQILINKGLAKPRHNLTYDWCVDWIQYSGITSKGRV